MPVPFELIENAIAAAARLGGISGSPKILSPQKKSLSILDLLLGESRVPSFLNSDNSGSHIRFEYLWR